MKVVVKKVGEPAEIEEIVNTPEAYMKIIGGDFQIIPYGAIHVNIASLGKGNLDEAKTIEGVILLCDKESLLKYALNEPINFTIPRYGSICGNAIFVGGGAENFRDLTDSEAECVIDKLKEEK